MPLDPEFVSVAKAAELLGDLSHWQIYDLLNAQKIESRYQGRRRLVVLSSLRKYAASLPTERPESVA